MLPTRIGTLIAAAGVVGGLLITQIFSSSRRHPLTIPGDIALIVALASIILVSITLVRIWWPADRFNVNLDPSVIIAGIDADPDAPIGNVYRDFLLNISDAAATIQVILTGLQRWFSWASIAFLVGVIALGVALWDVLTGPLEDRHQIRPLRSPRPQPAPARPR